MAQQQKRTEKERKGKKKVIPLKAQRQIYHDEASVGEQKNNKCRNGRDFELRFSPLLNNIKTVPTVPLSLFSNVK